jgi:hypothetical protein
MWTHQAELNSVRDCRRINLCACVYACMIQGFCLFDKHIHIRTSCKYVCACLYECIHTWSRAREHFLSDALHDIKLHQDRDVWLFVCEFLCAHKLRVHYYEQSRMHVSPCACWCVCLRARARACVNSGHLIFALFRSTKRIRQYFMYVNSRKLCGRACNCKELQDICFLQWNRRWCARVCLAFRCIFCLYCAGCERCVCIYVSPVCVFLFTHTVWSVVDVCSFVYVRMCVYTHVMYIFVCMYIYVVHTYTYDIHIYIYVCVCVCVYTHTYTHIDIYMHVCIQACMCVFT